MASSKNGFTVPENAEDLFHALCDRNGLNLDRKKGLSPDIARSLFLIALESRSIYSKRFSTRQRAQIWTREISLKVRKAPCKEAQTQ